MQAGDSAGKFQAEIKQFKLQVQGAPQQALQPGKARDPGLPFFGNMQIHFGQYPGWGALKQRQLCDLGGNRGQELNRGGAGAHYRYALARQIQVMPPTRRVKVRPGKAVQAGNIGRHRHMHGPAGHHHKTCAQQSQRGVQMPKLFGVIPTGFVHFAVQAQVGQKAECGNRAAAVAFDFFLPCKHAAPARIGGK